LKLPLELLGAELIVTLPSFNASLN
jgi:hypothetical protein